MSTLGNTCPYYGGVQVSNPANVLNIPTGVVAPSPNLKVRNGTLAVQNSTGTIWGASTQSGGVVTWALLGGGTGALATLTGNSGGAIIPLGGNITLVGSGALAFAGTPNTLTGSITPGTALVATVTGGSGGALSPTAGNINLLGTANQITVAGAGSTETWSIPATFIAPGTIASTTTLHAGTSFSAGTTITATLGAITATNGNLVLTAAGNKMIRTSVATTTAAGANSIGSVTLVGGTATVNTTSVTASSLIQIWRQSIGATGAAALGMLSVGTITGGASFVINALEPADATTPQATDVSVIGWEIIN
jgi:hypothetical protein